MSSLYLSKGNQRPSLTIGVVMFVLFLATSIPAAALLYGGKDLSYTYLVAWAPWVFTFVLANGIREEVLFRGLFLKKYQVFLGLELSNFLQSIVFVLPHFGETYSPVMAIFPVITLFLGLRSEQQPKKQTVCLVQSCFTQGQTYQEYLEYFLAFS